MVMFLKVPAFAAVQSANAPTVAARDARLLNE